MKMTFKNLRFDFSNKNVLVVGGSRGIGKGVVDAFLDANAKVFYASRNESKEKSNAIFTSTDISNPNSIKSLFSKMNEFGGIDILINSAAINHCKPIENISIKEWDDVLDINLRSAFLICKLAIESMKKKQYGKIVNISSIAGRHRSIVSGIHYVSSKAGLIGLTKQLAYLVAPYNINVNVICPSQTSTDMLKKSMNEKEISKLTESIPLGRIASIEEQVGPILFLCSDVASYITGAVIDVNGGQI